MNVFICKNPDCPNFRCECELLPRGEYRFRDDAYGAGKWFSEPERTVTECCGEEMYEEVTYAEFEEMIGFEDE